MIEKRLDEWLDERGILATAFGLSTLTLTGEGLFYGARKTLTMFREAEMIMSLVAAANIEWVNRTLDRLDVRQYFDHIRMVDPGGYIGPQDWKNTFGVLGIWPQNGIVVSDGPQGGNYGIGVRYWVCVLRNGQIYNARKPNEGAVINIRGIAHLSKALLEAG